MRFLAVTLISILIPILGLAAPRIALMGYYWASIMVPHRFAWNIIGIQWTEIFAIVAILMIIISHRPKLPPLNAAVIILIVFFAWTALSTLSAFFPDVALEDLSDFGKVVLMALLTLVLIRTRDQQHALIWLIVLSGGFYATWGGLTKVVTLGGGATLFGPPTSMFSGENPFARLTLMLLPLTYFLFLQSKNRLVRIGLVYVFFLTIFAFLNTGSRGGLVAFAAMAGFHFLFTRSKIKLAIFSMILAASTAMVVPETVFDRFSTLLNPMEEITAQSRFDTWRYNIDLANSRPFFGGGFRSYLGNIPEGRTTPLAPHSNYFQVLGDHGYVGLCLYLSFMLVLFRSNARLIKLTKGREDFLWEHQFSTMGQLCLVGYLIGGITINHAYWELIYVIAALLIITNIRVRSLLDTTPVEPGLMIRPAWQKARESIRTSNWNKVARRAIRSISSHQSETPSKQYR